MAQWIRFERNGRLEFGTLQNGEIVVHKGDMFAGDACTMLQWNISIEPAGPVGATSPPRSASPRTVW